MRLLSVMASNISPSGYTYKKDRFGRGAAYDQDGNEIKLSKARMSREFGITDPKPTKQAQQPRGKYRNWYKGPSDRSHWKGLRGPDDPGYRSAPAHHLPKPSGKNATGTYIKRVKIGDGQGGNKKVEVKREHYSRQDPQQRFAGEVFN